MWGIGAFLAGAAAGAGLMLLNQRCVLRAIARERARTQRAILHLREANAQLAEQCRALERAQAYQRGRDAANQPL